MTNIVLFLFALAPFFDPVGQNFGIRWISMIFMVFLFLNAGVLRRKLQFYQIFIFLFLIVIMPAHGLLISFIKGGIITNEFKDTSYIAFSILLLVSIPIILNKDFYFTFYKNILNISLVACVLSFFLYFGINTENISSYLTEKSIAIIAERGILGINVKMIYFLAAPLFFIPLTYFLNKSFENKLNLLVALLPMLALIGTGTRSHIILGVVYFVWMIPNIFIKPSYAMNISIFKGLAALFCIILSVFLINYDLVYELVEAPKRNKLLIFYGDTFNDINTFIFGQGFNSISWDYNLMAWTEGASKTELTYFEYIRVFSKS